MNNKLTFVNGEKAACGCHYEFSSGGGEYSDVADVHLCALHAGGTSTPDDRKARSVADAREAFGCRYNSDPADPACAADLAVYSAGWRDAQPTLATVLDDRWKARILDGRTLKRDEMGLGDHPELPWLDEGMKPRGFFAALGLELTHTMAEDQLDGDALEAMSEAVNWTGWQPSQPQGDGWKLVAIFDTEEGPAAWWLRELTEAEDGTTTIRNLQAEVEKLKARMARVSRAGAASTAAVSQGEYPPLPPALAYANRESLNGMQNMDFAEVEPLPSEHRSAGLYDTAQMRAYFDLGRQPAAVAAPALALVERQAVDALCAVALAARHVADDSPYDGNGTVPVEHSDMEALIDALDKLDRLPDDQPGYLMDPAAKAAWALRRLLDSAPALEAPAAPAGDDDAEYKQWFQSEQGKPYQGMWEFARAAWMARAALAAAPQAPAAPGIDQLLDALSQHDDPCEDIADALGRVRALRAEAARLTRTENARADAAAAPVHGFTPGKPSEGVEVSWLLVRSLVGDGEGATDEADTVVLALRGDDEQWLVAGDWRANSTLDSVHEDGGWIVGWMPYEMPAARLAAAPQAPAAPLGMVHVLPTVIRKLIEELNKASPGNTTTAKAEDYLKLHALRMQALGTATAATAELSQAERDVLAERRRQISAEGFSHARDDQYVGRQLAGAATSYLILAAGGREDEARAFSPWRQEWLKPGSPRRYLEKVGALVLAEMERLDRAVAQVHKEST